MDAPQEGGQDAGNIDAEDAAGESDVPKVISYSLSFVYSTYAGGDIFDQASWSPAEYIVESDTTALATQKAGAIVTTGEPTKAVVGGETEVYFVYGVMLADGSLDLNVGVITER